MTNQMLRNEGRSAPLAMGACACIEFIMPAYGTRGTATVLCAMTCSYDGQRRASIDMMTNVDKMSINGRARHPIDGQTGGWKHE
jgi:hypothetical protein